jgi:F420H(2)-dependent quinone reductase
MDTVRQRLPAPRYSAGWHRWLPIQYRLIRLLDPLVRTIWRGFGLGNVVELRVVGRRTGATRSVLLGLLRDGERWFLGHPNGDVAWTLNLEAAGTALLVFRPPTAMAVTARRLEPGDLRDRAIAATGQHVFPGNLVYQLARAHIRAVGTYFLIEVGD